MFHIRGQLIPVDAKFAAGPRRIQGVGLKDFGLRFGDEGFRV